MKYVTKKSFDFKDKLPIFQSKSYFSIAILNVQVLKIYTRSWQLTKLTDVPMKGELLREFD